MDKLRSLSVFVAVAEAESFVGGARTMGISAPSATRGVNELEERLGALLFTRTTRIVRLTDIGRAYLEEVRGILAEVGQIRRLICGAPDYFEKHGMPQSPEDLVNHKIVSALDLSSRAVWRFGKLQDRAIKITPRLMVTSVAAANSLVRSGWGIKQVFSYQVDADLQSGALISVLEDYETEPLPVHLVHHEGRRVSIKVRSFIDFAQDRLRQSLGSE